MEINDDNGGCGNSGSPRRCGRGAAGCGTNDGALLDNTVGATTADAGGDEMVSSTSSKKPKVIIGSPETPDTLLLMMLKSSAVMTGATVDTNEVDDLTFSSNMTTGGIDELSFCCLATLLDFSVVDTTDVEDEAQTVTAACADEEAVSREGESKLTELTDTLELVLAGILCIFFKCLFSGLNAGNSSIGCG